MQPKHIEQKATIVNNILICSIIISKNSFLSFSNLLTFFLFTYQLGESKSGLNANFEGPPQNYEELKQRHLNAGTLFEDNTFPASDASFYLHGRGQQRFKWLRPGEIVDSPKFFNEGAERFDVNQGEIGNCWLLAGN